jgi:protein-S-isoprenylcysteine O-methyltransferase Ste14
VSPAPARAPLVTWLGGAAFVVSLATFAWAYFVAFGRPAASADTIPPILADTTLFTAFALHHSLLARSGAKQWVTRRVSSRLERSLYVWVASLLFLVVCLAWQPVPGVVYHVTGVWTVLNWFGMATGAWLTVRAAGVLDPLELAGIRQASEQPPPAFKIAGPFRWVRHPLYLGWVLLVFGVPHMTATRLVFAVVSTAYLVVAIPFEERSLVEVFGDTYRDYQRQVRWRMIPGLW